MDEKNQIKTLLQEFLQNFEQIPKDIVEALVKVTADEDEKNIINSLAPALNNQFRELSANISDLSIRASKQNVYDVEQVIKISSGIHLAKSLKLALPSIGSLIGKLGINEIIMAFKKIVRKIFELLGKEIPKWLDAILLIIDEIIKMFFGGSSLKMINLFSHAEQNFLSELTHLSKLERATYGFVTENEDEE